MRQLFYCISLWLTLVAGAVQAGDRAVVVELFTSQGCSACPPADAFLKQLSKRGDVIALALHVDYWDYIGWKDEFADPRHTGRQKAYASAAGRRMVYTPQMVVNGVEHVVGTHLKDVVNLISRHRDQPQPLQLNLSRKGDQLQIRAEATGQITGPLMVQVVRYLPERKVAIRSGENAGRVLSYSNIVTSWQHVQEWDPRRPLKLTKRIKGDSPVVVVLQQKGPGAIVAAARLR